MSSSSVSIVSSTSSSTSPVTTVIPSTNGNSISNGEVKDSDITSLVDQLQSMGFTKRVCALYYYVHSSHSYSYSFQ
jgi:hypothetical protein